jgi:hypothetical protein
MDSKTDLKEFLDYLSNDNTVDITNIDPWPAASTETYHE